MLIPGKSLRLTIEFVQSSEGADPEFTRPVFKDVYHLIVAQRMRIGRVVLVTGKLP